MLIKKSIVEKWYQTDSWVYKNFVYLFQNPLWHKKIPNGFSVCPYFWLNLFSLFLFRPFFVAPIKYVLLPIIITIGKPANVMDKWLNNIWQKVNLGIDDYFPACGTMFTLLYSVSIFAAGFMFLSVGIGVHNLYQYLEGDRPGLFVFWSMASLVGLFITIIIHKLITMSECKTMYYLFVWFALFIISLFVFIPTDFIQLMTTFFADIIESIKVLVIIFGHGFNVFFGYIWTGIKYIVLGKPTEMLPIPWWGYLLILSAIGWICNKIGNYIDKKEMNRLIKNNPDELHSRIRSAWVDLFIKILLKNKQWKNNKISDSIFFDPYTEKVYKTNRYSVLRQTFEVMWKDEIIKLQSNYPCLSKDGWKALDNDDDMSYGSHLFVELKDHLSGISNFPEFDISKFIIIMRNVVENDLEIQATIAKLHAYDKSKNQLQEIKNKSWSHLMCLKVTNTIAKGVCSIGNTIKWTFCQMGTFLVYMWILIKAKKQGACPYFVFTTPKCKRNSQ